MTDGSGFLGNLIVRQMHELIKNARENAFRGHFIASLVNTCCDSAKTQPVRYVMHESDTQLSDEDFDTIRRLEEILWISETRFDPAFIEKIFAKDFFEFGRSGRTYARAEMVFDPSKATVIECTLPFPSFHARHLSEDIVQVTYVSEVVYSSGTERANRSSIWSRNGDDWVLRFHQGTPIR
ncbi:DUF4440 domain-containing protein [Agrobacterium vaccinii]|uniref:nuclear transport factor 2 family protein n=1 Tax=Agrobacterium vaccinii TaxID=2735528 RepID=UPI001E642358|nr:DUF4440 domain-containing protein [Agrobacterium vaccinii]UHS61634.1 DUF4440 domain-containing protein [Agrobacterium vaccinii]